MATPAPTPMNVLSIVCCSPFGKIKRRPLFQPQVSQWCKKCTRSEAYTIAKTRSIVAISGCLVSAHSAQLAFFSITRVCFKYIHKCMYSIHAMQIGIACTGNMWLNMGTSPHSYECCVYCWLFTFWEIKKETMLSHRSYSGARSAHGQRHA